MTVNRFQNTKDKFLQELENRKDVAYTTGTFDRLFELFQSYELFYNKDLYEFTSNEIYLVFKTIANTLKYTSVLTYNSYIKDYKKWVYNNINSNISIDSCSVEMLESINNFKQYVIFNDIDILNLTQYNKVDGANYNIAIFIKLFWEIDGQEDVKDILALQIENIDKKRKTVKIYNSKNNRYNEYPISTWLLDILLVFASLDRLTFTNSDKKGSYKIKPATENCGYVFRMTLTSRTKVGVPIDGVKFSNMLGLFCQRNKLEVITINDLKMSLALRYMLKNKKSHFDMYYEQRYFKNIPPNVYADVFYQLGKEKYPSEYDEYVNYFTMLEKKLNMN